jgi:hypothetical protein
MADPHTTSKTRCDPERDRRLERAIVLQALREDHPTQWSARELAAELGDEETAMVECALSRLVRERVLERSSGTLEASRPTRWLSELALIAV